MTGQRRVPRVALLLCNLGLAALGCAEIGEPAPYVPPEEHPRDGGVVAGPYDGPCPRLGAVVERGIPFGHLPTDVTGTVVNFTALLIESDGVAYRIEAHAVGRRDNLLDRIIDLSRGGNDNLGTCQLCVVVWSDCEREALSADECAAGPYFPTTGSAFVGELAAEAAGWAQLEAARLELHPVDVGPGLHSEPRAADSCLYLDHLILSGRTGDGSGYPCQNGLHCEMQATASARAGAN